MSWALFFLTKICVSAKQQPISQPDPNQVGHVNALGMNLGRRSRIRRSKDEVSTIEIQGGLKKAVVFIELCRIQTRKSYNQNVIPFM